LTGWAKDSEHGKTTTGAFDNPYAEDSDDEEDIESEPEQHSGSEETEALKLFQFHVSPTLEPERDTAVVPFI
jgi:hypothetical protein